MTKRSSIDICIHNIVVPARVCTSAAGTYRVLVLILYRSDHLSYDVRMVEILFETL